MLSQILIILGAFFIIEGIPYFAFPKKAKEWASTVHEIPDKTLRVIGLISMTAGIAFLYANRYF